MAAVFLKCTWSVYVLGSSARAVRWILDSTNNQSIVGSDISDNLYEICCAISYPYLTKWTSLEIQGRERTFSVVLVLGYIVLLRLNELISLKSNVKVMARNHLMDLRGSNFIYYRSDKTDVYGKIY